MRSDWVSKYFLTDVGILRVEVGAASTNKARPQPLRRHGSRVLLSIDLTDHHTIQAGAKDSMLQ